MEIASVLRLQIESGINLLFITVMIGFLVYIFINSKRTRVLYCYCFMHTLLILLFAFNFASLISPNYNIRWFCIAAAYIVKLFFDVLFVLYIRHFFNPAQKIISLVLVIIYIAAGSILIITDPLHHLFISKMTDTGTIFGILYYIFMGAGYVIQTAGMLCIMKYWIRRLDNQAYRSLSSVLALVSILLLHLSLLKIIRIHVDIFPLLILAGFAVYFIGALKYGMFDTISYGSSRSVDMYADAILIIDKKGKLHYRNKACSLLDEKVLQDILGRLHDGPLQLAVLSERNRLAKEIHDVIGHSLILALNTMESNKLLDKDIPSAMRRINQAVSEIGSSLDEISSTRGNEPDPAYIAAADRSSAAGQAGTSRTDLAERLDTLAARLSESGITLELAAMDDLAGCRENVINTLYRVCQESVTNAIKHGQASRITLSIKSKAGTVELFIVDNGKGCMSLIKGTGLTSMEERVRELNGTISFGSFEDREGFMVRVGIPIQL